MRPGSYQPPGAPRSETNVLTYGARGDGVADDTAAIQRAINAVVAADGGVVYLPHGKYRITDTLLVNLAGGVQIVGDGYGLDDDGIGWGTSIFATTSMAGKAMVEFRDSRNCAIRRLNIHGVSGAGVPAYGVRSHATGAAPSTNLWVDSVFFGGISSRTLTEGIGYTFTTDANNDQGVITDCTFYYLEFPIFYRGAQCLVHRIERSRFVTCKSGITLQGGSFTMSDCTAGNGLQPWYDAATGVFVDFQVIGGGGGAQRYTHRSHIDNLINEGSGNPMVKSANDTTTDQLMLSITNSEMNGTNQATGQVVYDWNAPNSHLAFVNCWLDVGQPSVTASFSAATSDVAFVNCKFGSATFTYAGTLDVIGGYVPAGAVFTASGASAKLNLSAAGRTQNQLDRNMKIGDTSGNNDSYLTLQHKASGNGGLIFATEASGGTGNFQFYQSGNSNVLYLRDLANGRQQWTLGQGTAGNAVNWIQDEVQTTRYRIGATNGTGPTWTSGTGTPEGVVTAPVGSQFTRTDGGAGTCFYVKESGAGNTGWVAK